MEQPHSHIYEIRVNERSADGGVPMHQIGNYLQDIAGRHASALGWSIDSLLQSGKSWVLSRLKIKLHQPVTKKDSRLTVQTWPCGADRMYAYRAFKIRNQENEIIGGAITAWVLLDLNSRRPAQMPPEIIELAKGYPEPFMPPPGDRLHPPDESFDGVNYRVNPTDMDVNGHVNHTVYIRWLEDTIALQSPDPVTFKELDISFKEEVKQGEEVIVSGEEGFNNHLPMAVMQSPENVVCLAQVALS